MGTLFVGGKPLGPWPESKSLFAEAARAQAIEFRDESGAVIAKCVPAVDSDWVAAITPEEIARREAGLFLTLAEYRQQQEQP